MNVQRLYYWLSLWLALMNGAVAQATAVLGVTYCMSDLNNYPEAEFIPKVMQIAVDEINNNTAILPNVSLAFVIRDSLDATPQGIANILQLIQSDGVSAIIGDTRSELTQYEAQVSGYYRKAQFGLQTAATTLSNRTLYPSLVSLIEPNKLYIQTCLAFVVAMGWRRIAIVYGRDTSGMGALADAEVIANQLDLAVILKQGFYGATQGDRSELVIPLQNLKESGANIILLCASPWYSADLYLSAYNIGLVGRDYVWMGLNEPYYDFLNVSWFQDDPVLASQGYITATQVSIDGPGFKNFSAKWAALVAGDPAVYPPMNEDSFGDALRSLYDVIYIIALAWTDLIHKSPSMSFHELLWINYTYIAQYVKDLTFDGASGILSFDSQGIMDRPFLIQAYQGANSSSTNLNTIALYENGTINLKCSGCRFLNNDGTSFIPLDYTNINCPPGWEPFLSNLGEWICTPCLSGTYNLNYNSSCLPCPTGATCSGSTLMVTENYWYNPRAQDITSAFLYCGSDNRCCSGTCPISENNTCSNNHFGVLCGSCPNGMYEWSGRCVYCNNTVQNTLMYTFTFLLTFIGVGIIYIIPPSKDNFFVDLLFIYQISFMFNFSDNNLIQSSLSILSFNTNISISSGCIFPFTSLLKMISSFFIPVAMFVCQILWYIIARIILSLEPRSHLAKKTIRTWLHYFPHLKGGLGNSNIGVMLTILLFCYTPVYNAAVNILSCRQVEGYPPVVWSYPSIQCWVGYHLVFSIIAGVLLVALGLVLPISIYKHVTRHYKGEATEKAVPKPAQIDPYQILYCCYTPGWYWWMPIDLVERSVVSGVPVLIQSRGEYVTTYCVVILLWMFLLIRVFTMPYRSPVDNSVKIVGYTALILLGSFRLQVTYFFQTFQVQISTPLGQELACLVLPMIILFPMKFYEKVIPKLIKIRSRIRSKGSRSSSATI